MHLIVLLALLLNRPIIQVIPMVGRLVILQLRGFVVGQANVAPVPQADVRFMYVMMILMVAMVIRIRSC